MKKFASVFDLQQEGKSLSGSIGYFIDKALSYKRKPWQHEHLGKQKRIGLVFLNPSLRTRMSTQIAAEQLGMKSIVFNIGSEGWSWEMEDGAIMNGTSVEHIKDAVPVLSSYFDVLAIRTFPTLTNQKTDYSEQVLNSFIHYSNVPVISLESATLHPLQSFTDLITIKELEIKKPKVVLCWAPHIKALPQCVPNSFAQWCIASDEIQLTIAHPPGYELAETFTKGASIIHDKSEALKDADIIYLKNWSAYSDYGAMPAVIGNWMLQPSDLLQTNDPKIMHCLPVRRNIEVCDALLDSHHSIVNQQAANRVWAAQAVLSEILQTNYD